MTRTNRQIHLVSRPKGEASTDNFRLLGRPVGEPGDGQVLVRHHYLSLDPYMRGRMDDAKSYAQPQPLDQVMQGGTVGVVEGEVRKTPVPEVVNANQRGQPGDTAIVVRVPVGGDKVVKVVEPGHCFENMHNPFGISII